MRPTTLDVADPMAVFAFVLDSLPDRVKVYPTENYYYFTFTHNGVDYAGNIRLDASDRDQGKGAVCLLRANQRLARRYAGRVSRA